MFLDDYLVCPIFAAFAAPLFLEAFEPESD
jgi:hypothetical protein